MKKLVLPLLLLALLVSCKEDDVELINDIITSEIDYDTLIDIEANSYLTVNIGEQTWMAQNLRVTKFNDSTSITNVTNLALWNDSIPSYAWYNNDAASSKEDYGALYSYGTLITEKLCPIGWHVPDDNEWKELDAYLGGDSIAGNLLKESGTNHWFAPNNGATNETGFNGLPGGGVFYEHFNFQGEFGYWWAYTGDIRGYYWSLKTYLLGKVLHYENGEFFWVLSEIGDNNGMSVRCLKD